MWLIPLVDNESPVHLLDKIEREKKKTKPEMKMVRSLID
jgi:hypothetical protein